MKPEPAVVRAFLADIHAAAAKACEGLADPGLLQVCRIHPHDNRNRPTVSGRFAIGDVERMVEVVIADAEAGYNCYVEGRTVRIDTPRRGTGDYTGAVFALVIERDGDRGKDGGKFLEPSMCVETSPGNTHHWYFLDRVLPYKAAQRLGAAIRGKVGADADSAVPVQPYRIAGTPNFPHAEKVARGRVVCETRYQNGGPVYSAGALLEAAGGQLPDEAVNDPAFNAEATGEIDPEVERLLAEPLTKPNRSKRFTRATKLAVERGMTATDFEALCRANPQGCAQKYIPPERRHDELRKRIGEIWRPHAAEQARVMALAEGILEHHNKKKIAPNVQATAAAEDGHQKQQSTGSFVKPNNTKPTLDDLLNSAADLQHLVFPKLKWIIPDYLPEGVTLLVGKPKVGKSWLALDVGVATASGGTCLGKPCEQGDALGLLLEDTKRRIQRRITTMLGIDKSEWPARFTYATSWPLLDEGGLDLIREWIARVEKPRLVIIDVLQKVRAQPKRNDTQYAADYAALTGLQQLAGKAGISILVLHHQRKAAADDLHDTVSGTHGLTGSADATLVLGRDDNGKFLYGRGRDLEEFNVAVRQDENCRWRVAGPAAQVNVSDERAEIIAVLKAAASPMGPKQIAAALPGAKYQNIKVLLVKMLESGVLEKTGRGQYRLPP